MRAFNLMFCITQKSHGLRFMLLVCFSYSSNGVLASMLFNRWHKRAGLQFCLDAGITAFFYHVSVIFIYFLFFVDYTLIIYLFG
jgi:hypothetical protein